MTVAEYWQRVTDECRRFGFVAVIDDSRPAVTDYLVGLPMGQSARCIFNSRGEPCWSVRDHRWGGLPLFTPLVELVSMLPTRVELDPVTRGQALYREGQWERRKSEWE